jgi:hypothetical protein
VSGVSTFRKQLLRCAEKEASLDEMKDLFGDEYLDYDLVFCSSNGHPLEASYINRGFSKLIRENDLPKVAFTA